MWKFKANPEFSELEGTITPEWAYLNRRQLMQAGLWGAVGLWAGRSLNVSAAEKLKFRKNSAFSKVDPPREPSEKKYPLEYNNFYEFSLDKSDVAEKAKNWKIASWKLEVSGLVKKPRTLDLKELTTAFDLEERIYRFRCVEAWSMVLPWVGFPLAKLLDSVHPKSEAKFVKFTSFNDPKVMPNIKKLDNYPWPYTEGLTLQEARNPLTLLAVGMYGEPLHNQNGAPIRLVTPWKYGFKSIKSLVKIELVSEQPKGLWQTLAPNEYGFYANVNPHVDHPRWSQASERVVDGRLFPKRIPTLMFNGYESYVASMYKGLDLKKNY